MLTVGLVTGCTSLRVVCRDPDFRAPHINTGRVGVGGVTPLETIEYMEQDRIAQMVRDRLQTRWPQSQVLGQEEVRRTLGAAEQQRMLGVFSDAAVLPREELARLRPLAERMRYLMLVDIRQNEVDQEQSLGWDYEETTSYNPWTHTYDTTDWWSGYVASSVASRRIRCAFVVYDLQGGRPVWIATGCARGSASNSARDSRSPPYLSPMGPPATSDLMNRILRRLARKLPAP